MNLLELFDKIFTKKSINENTEALLKSLTNFTQEDFEILKIIASGSYNEYLTKNTEKPGSFLDMVQGALNRSYTSYGEGSPQTRKQLYRIYDEMDEEVAYVSAALDIISDDATQPDQDGVIIKVYSSSEKVASVTQDLIDDFELEERLSKWARAVAKYGDFFIKVQSEEGKGILKLSDDIYPSRVERIDFDGELVAFSELDDSISSSICEPWKYVHFKHKGDIYNDQEKINNLTDSATSDHKLSSSYGQSILRPAIKVYAQLRFVENMLLLSRLTNSIRRNIFMINVGETAPDKAFDVIHNYANLLKKNVSLDLENNVYNSQKKTVTYDEDIFIPVADPKNDVRIEQVGGDVNIAEQYDLEYLLNKLFSALKVPKAYLNYEQDLNARSTLIQLDIRYARSVTRVQQTLRGGLLRLAYINLAFLGVDPNEVDLDIQLTAVSTIDAEAKRQELRDEVDVANSIWRTVCDVNDKLVGNPKGSSGGLGDLLKPQAENSDKDNPIDLKFAAEHILSKHLGFSNEDIDLLFKKGTEEDPKKPKKVVFHRVKSSDPDIHAPYPTKESRENFTRLREEINNKIKKGESADYANSD